MGDVLVKIKRSSNARDVRDVLLALAYALAQEPHNSQALCLLTKSRLTSKRLSEELARFRLVVRPALATRIMLAALDDAGQLLGAIPQDNPELRDYLKTLVHQAQLAGVDRVSRESVKSHLASLWLQGQAGQSLAALQRDTKASHPTVTAALADLDQQGQLDTDRKGAMFREPTWDIWRRLAEAHAGKRTMVRFTDPSGLSRSVTDMAQRLQSLQKRGIAKSVALGGVVGATHYYPALDITAPPRLDLSVFDGDTSFVRQLDAGLVVSENKAAKAVLVVHLTPGGERFVQATASGRVAPPLDCLADLWEIGLAAEAQDFALALNRRAKSKREAEQLK
jgi:hypothetical protein